MLSFSARLLLEACILGYAIVLLYSSSTHPTASTHPLAGVRSLDALRLKLNAWASLASPLEAADLTQLGQELDRFRPATQELPDPSADVFYILAQAGTQCYPQYHTDLGGDALVWGGGHHTDTAAECCAACAAHRQTAARGGLAHGRNSTTCNVWVHCGDAALCGEQYQECWLKHDRLPALPEQPRGRTADNVGWTAGALYDAADPAAGSGGQTPTALTLHTDIGRLRLRLRPDLAPASVRELARMAAMLRPGGACDGCHIYRAERDFLIQGVIAAPGFYVATPREEAPPQQKVMERGLVCWAGGGGGPDFFINLINQPGFSDSHMCWANVYDDDMALVDSVIGRPLRHKTDPKEMTFLETAITFNMTAG